jgi:hypothetical protein
MPLRVASTDGLGHATAERHSSDDAARGHAMRKQLLAAQAPLDHAAMSTKRDSGLSQQHSAPSRGRLCSLPLLRRSTIWRESRPESHFD